jgi:L-threonylcarbamoyladenylate synthase
MKTLRLTVDPENPGSESSRSAIDHAASILRQGGIVAFPTETVYGLGANALNPVAVEKIFIAKSRPAWDPLIVHIAARADLCSVSTAQPTLSSVALMERFWPGALTLLLPRADAVPAIVTANRPLVGVRLPSHPVAHALLVAAGIPIAAPSANSFGRISPTLAAHVLEDLDGRIDAVLDGGETAHGLESTVVDASREPVIVYRPGIISIRQIRELCASAIQWTAKEAPLEAAGFQPESMPSPGIGVRHYAPRTPLFLVSGEGTEQVQAFGAAFETARSRHQKSGVMLPSNFLPEGTQIASHVAAIFDWGDWQDLEMLAHRLFAGLRYLDNAGVQLILCPLPPPEGVGSAIRDRLLKAAQK